MEDEEDEEDEDAAVDRCVRHVQEEDRLEAMLPDVPNTRTSAADSPSTAGDHTSTSDDAGGAVDATRSYGEGSQPHPRTEPPYTSNRRRDTSDDSEAHLSVAVELIDDYFRYNEITDVRRTAKQVKHQALPIKAKAKKKPPGSGLPPSWTALCSDAY